MQIKLTPETLLKQLKIGVNDQNLLQMQKIIDNTKDNTRFFKHLFSLNDTLAPYDAFIAPSNSVDYLKIKYHGNVVSQAIEFRELVIQWSAKHKVVIEPVEGKDAFYIKGFEA